MITRFSGTYCFYYNNSKMAKMHKSEVNSVEMRTLRNVCKLYNMCIPSSSPTTIRTTAGPGSQLRRRFTPP